jgi:hypothetical protein
MFLFAISRIYILSSVARSRESAVGTATGYRLDGRGVGVRVPVRARFFLHVAQTGSGAHPAFYSMGIEGSFPGGKRPGREADHSPPSAEVKNT